jgi:hypothetical protein
MAYIRVLKRELAIEKNVISDLGSKMKTTLA